MVEAPRPNDLLVLVAGAHVAQHLGEQHALELLDQLQHLEALGLAGVSAPASAAIGE